MTERLHQDKPSVEVFFRFQVLDAQTGLPYTVTISQEGVSRKQSEAPETEVYDRHYRAHVNHDLQVELIPEAPTPSTAVSAPPQAAAQTVQPTVQGRHDLRQLLNR